MRWVGDLLVMRLRHTATRPQLAALNDAFGDIVVGIIGAVVAGWLLPRIGIVIGVGFIASVIDAFIGAVILLIVLRLIKRFT